LKLKAAHLDVILKRTMEGGPAEALGFHGDEIDDRSYLSSQIIGHPLPPPAGRPPYPLQRASWITSTVGS
jgi:hypothetical protein